MLSWQLHITINLKNVRHNPKMKFALWPTFKRVAHNWINIHALHFLRARRSRNIFGGIRAHVVLWRLPSGPTLQLPHYLRCNRIRSGAPAISRGYIEWNTNESTKEHINHRKRVNAMWWVLRVWDAFENNRVFSLRLSSRVAAQIATLWLRVHLCVCGVDPDECIAIGARRCIVQIIRLK